MEKLIVAQVVKSFSQFKQLEDLFQHSQEADIGLYRDPHEFSPYTFTTRFNLTVCNRSLTAKRNTENTVYAAKTWRRSSLRPFK